MKCKVLTDMLKGLPLQINEVYHEKSKLDIITDESVFSMSFICG